jgi:hypothetical protein
VPDLEFIVEGAEAIPFAAVPQVAFHLRVTNRVQDEVVGAVILRAQLQLAVARRHYSAAEEAQLRDLFGTTDRWGQTLRGMLWTQATVIVPRFTGDTLAELVVPCSFDFNVGATKYFHALEHGEIPVEFLFSGSIFYETEEGALQVYPVSWEKEAAYRLPVSTWRDVIDRYYPNTAWLTVRRDLFEQIYKYKAERGIPTWDRTFESILASARSEAVT